MDEFIHQVLTGLATGGIYASIALALVMIYQSTHLVNFAQGEMAMLSTYFAWSLFAIGMSYWIVFPLTLAASFIFGALVERIIIRPVGKASTLSVIAVFIGLMSIMTSLAGLVFSYTIKSVQSPFSQKWQISNLLSAHETGMLFVMLCVLTLVFLFFRFSSLGLAMRAAALDPLAARLAGIRVKRMLSIGWGLAGAIGAVAGMMAAPIVYLDPHMMSGIIIYGFAAALLGGISNPLGAVLGGFIVGVLENICGVYLVGTELKLTVALIIIIAIVLVKPAGLFGKKIVTRV